MPYLIILLGIPGCGKTSLIDKIQKEFHIQATTILVDKLIQKSPLYKKQVDSILQTCNSKCITHPNKLTYKKFENAYWKTRKYGCKSSCDDVNDTHIFSAIKKQNDIIFETSGTSSLEWLIKLVPHYKIVFYVVLVDLHNLMHRSIHRNYKEYTLYMINHKIAPRLPQSDKSFLTSRFKKFHKLLNEIFKNKNGCSFRIIIYDNVKLKKIYDGSGKDTERLNLLIQPYFLNDK